LLLGTLISLTATLSGQSSVDEARKAKPTKKATRVITDDDIPSRPVVETPTNPSEDGKASGTEGAQKSAPQDRDAKASEQKDKDEDRATTPSAKIADLKSDEANLTRGIQELQTALDKEEDPGRREALENMITNRTKSLNRTKAEREQLQAKTAPQ
jgi:hypothetical protein